MRNFAKHALWGVAIAGGITLLGASAANAADTEGDDGLLSGTQVVAVVDAPITAVGNAISVVGDSISEANAPAPAAPADAPAAPATTTSGDDSIGGGTQAVVDAAVPVTVTDNAISVIGDSESSTDSAAAPAEPAEPAETAAETSGDEGILGGTQAVVAAVIPVNVSGNAISVVGDSESSTTGAAADAPTESEASAAGGTEAGTSGDDAILGGTQLIPDITLPVTVTGNAISVLGDSDSATDGTATTTPAAGETEAGTSGDDGILGGSQILPTVTVPITVTGNAISVLGDSDSATDGTATATPATPAAGGTEAGTSGDDGILGGSQILPTVTAPITASGNAVSVLGDSSSEGAGVVPGPTGGSGGAGVTSGDDGILGGTQLIPTVTLPITIGGNAISVIGDTTTETPATPVDPTDPVDPTVPVDPTDPTDPATPATPGANGSDGTADTVTIVGQPAAVGTATPLALAETGGTGLSIGLLLAAALALAGGGLLLTRRRTA